MASSWGGVPNDALPAQCTKPHPCRTPHPQISKDKLTQLANKHWSSAVLAGGEAPAFSEELVQQIYRDELGGGSDSPPSLRRCAAVHR